MIHTNKKRSGGNDERHDTVRSSRLQRGNRGNGRTKLKVARPYDRFVHDRCQFRNLGRIRVRLSYQTTLGAPKRDNPNLKCRPDLSSFRGFDLGGILHSDRSDRGAFAGSSSQKSNCSASPVACIRTEYVYCV